MAEVYAVRDTRTGAKRALKVLRRQLLSDREARAGFAREVAVASRVEHVTAKTFESGVFEDGRPFFTMELLEGAPLDALIRRHRLGLPYVVRVAGAAARALQIIHDAGIIHRDVKPENLFVTASGEVKVLDFGLSRCLATSGVRMDVDYSRVGTPHYMSPEQAAGTPHVGPTSDIYSLGVVLYECITGRRPFQAHTRSALWIAIHTGCAPSPSCFRAAVSEELEGVVRRAMHVTPRRRFASMDEMASALEACAT